MQGCLTEILNDTIKTEHTPYNVIMLQNCLVGPIMLLKQIKLIQKRI